MAYRTASPAHVPAPAGGSDLRPGDPLGAFTGYLRRPKSSAAGLTCQVFGENGEDADKIAALHLTRFLDQPVKVTVWMLKDRNGRSMKQNGQWPKIAEFVGLIRRPQASNNGQVAQFFGENGANADALSALNQTSLLDALVYVEMHQASAGMTVGDLPTGSPEKELDSNAGRLTTVEAEDLKRLQKKSEEAMRLLALHNFFRQKSVLAALGRADAFLDWLGTQPCCQPGQAPCDRHPTLAWAPPGAQPWQGLALCGDHRDAWEAGTVAMPDGSSALAFAQTQGIVMQQRWAQQALVRALKVPAGRLPTPGAVYAWAVEHGLAGSIPSAFKGLLG